MSETKGAAIHFAKRGARLCAVQALYQIDLTGKAGFKVVNEFTEHRISDKENDGEKIFADKEFFKTLVKETVEGHKALDDFITPRLAANWTLERIDSIVRAALRLATYELFHCPQTPIAVIIDEYVGIVAAFHEGKESGFTNGILQKIAMDSDAEKARQTHE